MLFESFLDGVQALVLLTTFSWFVVVSPRMRTALAATLLFSFATFVTLVNNVDRLCIFSLVMIVAFFSYKTVVLATPLYHTAVWLYNKSQEMFDTLSEEDIDKLTFIGPIKPDVIPFMPTVNDDHEFSDDEVDWLPGYGPTEFEKFMDKVSQFLRGVKFSDYEIVGLVIMYLAVVVFTVYVLTHIYLWFRRRSHRIRRGYEEIAETIFLGELTREKMAPGSPFLPNKKVPPFQAEVWISVDAGSFVYSGQGFRIGDNFWTARHVIAEADEIKILNPNNEAYILVKPESFKYHDGDIAIATLGNSKFSLLSLASAKFNGSIMANGVAAFVEITALSKKALGLLTPHDAFGFVTFSGSTTNGFSGAPYVVHNTVCGMHVGHQGVNLGYDGAFLDMVERSMKESTTDYVFDQIKKMKGKVKFLQSPYDPDEYRVRVGNKYYVVTSDEVNNYYDEEPDFYEGTPDYERENAEKVESKDQAMETQGVLAPRSLMYQDSGNELVAPAVANVTAGAPGPSSLAKVVVPTQVMQQLYDTPVLQFPAALNQLVTRLPASMPVEPNEALDITQVTQESGLKKERLELEATVKALTQTLNQLNQIQSEVLVQQQKKGKSQKKKSRASSPLPSPGTQPGASK